MPMDSKQRIKTYLAAQTKETLVHMLLEVSWRDERLAQSLLIKSAPAGQESRLMDEMRQLIDDVTTLDEFVDWRGRHSFSDPLDQAVDTLAELLTPTHAGALVELAQYAIEQTEAALEQVDDSNGQVGDVLCRLGDLHLKACALARPDPVELAHDLFHLETSLSIGVCSFSALTYKDVLGVQGLESYRALAQARWDALGPTSAQSGFEQGRFKITRVMEDLARATGNVDELIAIKSRDLRSAHAYLTIAELLVEDKRDDEAFQWAQRGLTAFPKRTDHRLRDFLVATHLKRNNPTEALQLTWIQFEEQPGLPTYQKLHDLAMKLGVWPAQRARALDCLDRATAQEASQTSHFKPRPSAPDTSRRLAIALWEVDLEAAWTALHSGQCQQNLRINLAHALGSTRAQDAIFLYRQIVPEIVGQTNNSAYESAVALIRQMEQLMTNLGKAPQFADYLAELRTAFKPKRNFIKLLDGLATPQRPKP